MPKITAEGKTIECEQGANLRQVLLENKVNPHNGNAALINCRGIGTCGTCAVAIAGKVSSTRRLKSRYHFRVF
jgi:ferredoxin